MLLLPARGRFIAGGFEGGAMSLTGVDVAVGRRDDGIMDDVVGSRDEIRLGS